MVFSTNQIIIPYQLFTTRWIPAMASMAYDQEFSPTVSLCFWNQDKEGTTKFSKASP
jgi:hypothetical protein